MGFKKLNTSLCGSKLKPPLYPPTDADAEERLLDPRGPPKQVPEHFNFQQFTYFADESATITESWYRNARAFFNIRLGKSETNLLTLFIND